TLDALSAGERQRVLLARALAVEAEVLLMDEPLQALDVPHQADWIAIVRELAGRGRTVVSVLHELSVALAADELVLVEGGRLAWHGDAAAAATHRALAAVFDQRVEVHAVAGRHVVVPR
ncbi:MAG: ATP-binding cassette domain-containing protein, partial [Burkholderiaceae bacterium]|nr:ATP-binding cassette domain-containing protein [Burkholderiaceae bacterium]